MNHISKKLCTSIQLHSVSKSYSSKKVLQEVSIVFEPGILYLVTGENGSGKSTLLKCIMKLIRFDGEIGMDKHVRIGYAPEQYVMPEFVTVFDFLNELGKLRALKSNANYTLDYYLNLFGLLEMKHKQIGKLSNGGKQKVNLIQAMMNEPSILILDEPFRALDVESQKQCIQLIRQRVEKGITIISTHELEKLKTKNTQVLQLSNGAIHLL
jgi:ABC-2 type transport system ATP-binding protein